MNMTAEELELIAFDPPHLGMPGRPSSCGRSEDGDCFVEIFVTVEEGTIIDVGFLTNIAGDGLVCASLCCDAALGKTLGEAAELDRQIFLARLPEIMREDPARADLAAFCHAALHQAVFTAQSEGC